MINTDVIIKLVRSRGCKVDWPDMVNYINNRINYIKNGFPGIRNNHLSLVEFSKIKLNDIFIFDKYINLISGGDEAPLMLKKLSSNKYLIEGIGLGVDSIRDPNRLNYRWKDIIEYNNILNPNDLVLRVDVRPDPITGGPGYYYFYKSYRDYRY